MKRTAGRAREFLPRSERKQRVLAYLREHPEAMYKDLREAGLASDLQIGYKGRISEPRRMLELGQPPRKGHVTKQERRERVLAYLREHPAAVGKELIEAGLASDLKIGYQGRINDAKKELDIPPLRRGPLHENTLAYDLWGLKLQENNELRRQLGYVIRGLLSKKDFAVARKYYGLGCRKHTLDRIGKCLGVTREAIRQRMERMVSTLGYLNRKHAIAQAYLPHAEGEARELLSGIP